MSQQVAPTPYPQYVMVPMTDGNGLGLAGFFIALFGLFIPTGIIALLGLLVSLVALGKAPRGFAGMGVLIGLFGTVVWIAITGVALLGALAIGVSAVLAGSIAFVLLQPEIIEVTSDMVNVTIAALEYEDKHDALPDDLDALDLSLSTRTDPWGNAYRYIIVDDDPGFDIVSSGSDGIMGTDDDLVLSQIDEVWGKAFENFGERIEEFGNRIERLQGRKGHFEYGGHHVQWGCGVSPTLNRPS